MMSSPRTPGAPFACALVVGLGVLLGASSRAEAKPDNDTLRCFDSLMKGARRYAVEAAQAISKCEMTRLETQPGQSCADNSRRAGDLANAAKKFVESMSNCQSGRFAAICPLESRTLAAFDTAVRGPEQSLETRFVDMISGAFAGGLLPQCPAPVTRPSTKARECGKAIATVWKETLDDALECIFDCELRVLKRDEGELCIDLLTGAASEHKLGECLAEVADDAALALVRRCDDAAVSDLGCPLAATSSVQVSELIVGGVLGFSEALNLKALHATCRTDTETTVPSAPGAGTLKPSGRSVSIACGSLLDSDFFDGDDLLVLNSHVNCDAARGDLDGLVITASDVTIDGQAVWGVNGPDVDSARTGAGIVIAAGTSGVTLKGIKYIRNFGVGAEIEAGASGVVIQDLSVRRNEIAGVLSRGNAVELSRIYADRNKVSFDLAGDDVVLVDSTARRTDDADGASVVIEGEDLNSNGRAIRVNDCLIESNKGMGLLVRGSANRVRATRILRGRGHALVIQGDGNRIEDNLISDNRAGHGVLVQGRHNVIQRNRSERNEYNGFQIVGSENELFFNEAGDPGGGRGNGGDGFVVAGALNLFGGNVATDNSGKAFELHPTTVDLGGNVAN